jgi:hypothetical protein
LGKTSSKNPHKYKGSGTYWNLHIRKHGYDVETKILLATNSKYDIKITGLFFSKIFNVVESKEFANLKEESGEGGWDAVNKMRKQKKLSPPTNTKESKEKRNKTILSKNPKFYKDISTIGNITNKKNFQNLEYREKYSKKHKIALPKNHQKGSTNSQYGKKYKFINDGKANKKVELDSLESYLKNGFVIGRI